MKIITIICLIIQIRSLEATAQGRIDILPMVRCEETRSRMILQHLNALAEIDRLKAEYRKLTRGSGIKAITGLQGGAA